MAKSKQKRGSKAKKRSAVANDSAMAPSESTPARQLSGSGFQFTTGDGLYNLTTGLGGFKDPQQHRGYHYQPRARVELEEFYMGSWLAAECVDIKVTDMTRAGRVFDVDDKDAAADLERAEIELGYWEKIKEASTWAHVHGGGGIFLGMDARLGAIDTPLEVEKVKRGDLLFMHAHDAETLIPWNEENPLLVTDPTSEHYLLPEFYQVAGAATPQRIHHTRVIRFNGFALPRRRMLHARYWGGSRLERLWGPIADADEVIHEIKTMLSDAKVDVLGVSDLWQKLQNSKTAAKLQERFELFLQTKGTLNGFFIDKDRESYDKKETSIVQGVSAILEQYLAIVAAAADIPVTRFLGTSAKGLNATGKGDLENYDDMIHGERNTFLRPKMAKLDQIFFRSSCDMDPDEVKWKFGSLRTETPKEKAEIEASQATTDQTYFNMGILERGDIAMQIEERGTYKAIDADRVAEIAAEDAIDPDPDPDLNDDDDEPSGPGESGGEDETDPGDE